MKEITKTLLEEAATEVLKEYNASHISGPPSPTTTTVPASEQIPSIKKSDEKEADETGVQPEEGLNRSGFGLSSNAFPKAIKALVKKELDKMLKQKEKKS